MSEKHHLTTLLDHKLEGHAVVLEALETDLQIDQINFLREFNSFFDQIHVNDKSAASLCGYLWDETIVDTAKRR